MRKKMRINKMMLATLPAIIGGLYSSLAGAAGFQLLEQNASGLGTAYAGSAAVAEDASTVFFNPAGMAFLPKGRNVAVGVDAIAPQVKFSDGGSTKALLQTPGSGNGGDAGDLAFVPHGYFTMPISDAISFGLGLGAPYGLKTEYDSGWNGRFQGIKSDVQVINLNPSLSFKASDKVALGFGLNYQHLKGEFTQAANYAGAVYGATGSAALAAAAGEGAAKITGSDSAWGYNFGAMFQLSPATRLGVSYRSAIKYHLTGSADFTSTASATVNGILASATSPARGGAIYSDIKIPDMFFISTLHHLDDKWDLMSDVSWTGWSKIPKLAFVYANGPDNLNPSIYNWRDTWRVAIGASYKYNAQWKARMGMAYDQTPVPDTTRTPRLPDSDRTWLSMGGQYKPGKDSAIDFGYTHIFVKNSGINNNACNDATCRAALPYGNLLGTYKNSVNILGAQYSFSF